MKKVLFILFIMTFKLETYKFDIENYIENNFNYYDGYFLIRKIADYYKKEYELIKYIFDICGNFDIDPVLFLSLIKIESDFIEDARSHTGAYGYCQITKIVLIDLNINLNRRNARENILIGAMFLDKLIGRYRNITNALIHYNVGTQNREKGEKYAKKIFIEFYKLKEIYEKNI